MFLKKGMRVPLLKAPQKIILKKILKLTAFIKPDGIHIQA
jgi:hypothetical protein